MSGNAMNNLSYGLSVVTVCKDGFDNGCITNTVSQVTSNPKQITIALNKESLTHDFIKETGIFSVSVLSEAASFVAKVINEEVISSLPSATYSYYQEYIKPKAKHRGAVVDIQSAANELERRARA